MAFDVCLKGKKPFVTGGLRGIGYGIADALASLGVDVAVGALHLPGASEAARVLETTHRVRCLAVQVDVRSDESVAAAAS